MNSIDLMNWDFIKIEKQKKKGEERSYNLIQRGAHMPKEERILHIKSKKYYTLKTWYSIYDTNDSLSIDDRGLLDVEQIHIYTHTH